MYGSRVRAPVGSLQEMPQRELGYFFVLLGIKKPRDYREADLLNLILLVNQIKHLIIFDLDVYSHLFSSMKPSITFSSPSNHSHLPKLNQLADNVGMHQYFLDKNDLLDICLNLS